MHAGTVNAVFGLGHKGCMQAMSFGNGLYRQFKGHDIVSGGKCFIIFKVDLMLGRRYLVVGRLDHKAHIFQRKNHISSCIFSQIQRP